VQKKEKIGSISSKDVENEVLKIVGSDNEHDGNGNTIFHQAEEYLRKKYDIRSNTISLDVEISEKGKNKWSSCNENNLYIELQKNGIKISINNLISILKSDFATTFNPLIDYFESLEEWDKNTDYIQKYSEYVKLAPGEDKDQFEYHFKKWLVRVVKCAILPGYFNKQAFILTDNGKGQNIGKSSWCRNLCPKKLSQYIAEDVGHNDKDSRILICKNLLINLDELAVLSRKEINQLKALFSKDQINDRLPYERKNSILPRVASFIGSTNKSTFLQDETGSVRWLCFVVENINWSYSKKFDIDKLWGQAYSLSKNIEFEESMTVEDIKQNERRNQKFQELSVEAQLLFKLFKIPEDMNNAEFMQSALIMNEIDKIYPKANLNNVRMGKALVAAGYERVKHKGRYGYWVEKYYNQ